MGSEGRDSRSRGLLRIHIKPIKTGPSAFLPWKTGPGLSTPLHSQPHPNAASSPPCPLYLFIPSARDMGDVVQGPDLRLDSVLEVQLLRFYFHLATP